MKLSYETAFRLKALSVAVLFGLVIFYIVYYPIISYNPVPYGVASPKGQLLLMKNITFGGMEWENAVDLYNNLVLKGDEDYGDYVVLELKTPGWCMDVVVWSGTAYVRKAECVRKVTISRYTFRIPPGSYWYLDGSYHLILYKPDDVPENYEMVNFTVTYGPKSDWGAFKAAYPKK
ncbi:hypothetical protein FH039_01220 [Thermococcus indicus]|uniref:Uncharacterized protein n=1 Tax=Thermococcus indicus TaxID=2586643 RepID=A0A4Y5SIB8_9EURY|nr:hypothetical protein [Thermococcus indicus]QDA30508.1 hypothetical protein FH039_01220 [Thermococcus indicus]